MAGQLVAEYPEHTKRNGCINCGAPRRPDEYLYQFDQTVDEVIGLDGEVYGFQVAVLCETCAVEIGTLMGCIGPAQAKRLQGVISDLQTQLAQQDVRLAEIRKTLSSV